MDETKGKRIMRMTLLAGPVDDDKKYVSMGSVLSLYISLFLFRLTCCASAALLMLMMDDEALKNSVNLCERRALLLVSPFSLNDRKMWRIGKFHE